MQRVCKRGIWKIFFQKSFRAEYVTVREVLRVPAHSPIGMELINRLMHWMALNSNHILVMILEPAGMKWPLKVSFSAAVWEIPGRPVRLAVTTIGLFYLTEQSEPIWKLPSLRPRCKEGTACRKSLANVGYQRHDQFPLVLYVVSQDVNT